MWETWVWFLGQEDPLEKEMAIHSSTLAWKIPWTEEADRLQSTGSQSWIRLSDFTLFSPSDSKDKASGKSWALLKQRDKVPIPEVKDCPVCTCTGRLLGSQKWRGLPPHNKCGLVPIGHYSEIHLSKKLRMQLREDPWTSQVWRKKQVAKGKRRPRRTVLCKDLRHLCTTLFPTRDVCLCLVSDLRHSSSQRGGPYPFSLGVYLWPASEFNKLFSCVLSHTLCCL